MQIVTGRRGEPHVTSRQMQAVYRSFLGDFALLDIGEKLRAEAYSNDIVRVYDGVVSVQGIYAVIAYNQYDEVYIEPVSVGKKRIDTIVLHYTKDNALDVEDMQLDVVQGEEYTDNPVPPTISEGGDAWEGTTDIQVAIYDVEVTNFGLTVTPYARMLNLIPTLESIAERIPDTVVTGVKGDSEVLYRDGNVNITKANIGLGNVDNTADTDKPISTATQTALNLKADLTYVDAKISAAYHAGGSKTVAELTSALLIADNIGKVYNMSDSGVTTSDFVEGAGKPIHEGDNVGICNVGTEESPVYKFDLLSGFVDLSAYATTSAVNTGLAGKVDKVTGKGLSTEDYTTTEKTKLAGISERATQTIANPADTATETLSKLEVEGVVYDIPQGASGATELSELTDVNLSNVEDNDILQYDETANKWKNSNALQGAKTLTGNPLTIEDAAPVNAVNLSMDLEPIQDLHGYDHPWVGGAGKNKLPMTVEAIKAANTIGTWNGNVYTLNDVTFTILTAEDNVTGIKVNGTASAVTKLNLAMSDYATLTSIGLTLGVSYSVNGCPEGGSFNNSYSLLFNAGNTANKIDEGTGFSITANATDTYIIQIYIRSGYNASNLIYKPMIRLATETDASFAPYTNKASISGRSEVAIQRVGKKNLLPIDITYIKSINTSGTWSGNTYTYNGYTFTIDDDGGIIVNTIGDGSTLSSIILMDANKIHEVFQNGNFYVDHLIKTENKKFELQYSNMQDGYYAKNNKISPSAWLGNYVSGLFDITNYPVQRFMIYIQDVVSNEKIYPIISKSANKTYTIQLGQTVYGGQLGVTRGKMVVDRGYATYSWGNGTNVTSLTNVTRKYFSYSSFEKKPIGTTSGVVNICDVCTEYVSFTEDTPHFYIDNSTESFVVFLPNNTSNDFTFNMCYELATPFTIDLTPQQIKMLENTNTIYTDYEGDTITIEYQPNNAIGEAVRVVEESYDPEFAVRPVLKKIAFSGTTDTDGSVTLINASDIPSGHKIIPLQITDMTIDGSAGTYFVEYKPYNSGDSVKGYCYFYMSGSQMFPVGKAITGNFYYYDLEV